MCDQNCTIVHHDDNYPVMDALNDPGRDQLSRGLSKIIASLLNWVQLTHSKTVRYLCETKIDRSKDRQDSRYVKK